MIKRAADIFYTLRFLKLLTTPFDKTKAFQFGIIDSNGKRNKNVMITSSEMKNSYTKFHKLVFNIKKIIGNNKLTSFASALYLLKENYNISDSSIQKTFRKIGYKPMLKESTWFITSDNQLYPGVYRLKESKILSSSAEELAFKGDKIRVLEDTYPIDDVLDIDIFEVIHIPTNQKIHIDAGELIK